MLSQTVCAIGNLKVWQKLFLLEQICWDENIFCFLASRLNLDLNTESLSLRFQRELKLQWRHINSIRHMFAVVVLCVKCSQAFGDFTFIYLLLLLFPPLYSSIFPSSESSSSGNEVRTNYKHDRSLNCSSHNWV